MRDSVQALLQKVDISAEDIIMYTLHPTSTIGSFLRSKLEIRQETYLRFFIVILIQGEHRISSDELFFDDGCWKDYCPMDQKEYNQIWNKI